MVDAEVGDEASAPQPTRGFQEQSSMTRPTRPTSGEHGGPGTDDRQIVEARQAVERANQRLLALSAEAFDALVRKADALDDEAASPADAAEVAAATAQAAADDEHARAVSAELERARRRARRPFGRRAARQVVALELAERLANDRSAQSAGHDFPISRPGVVLDLAELERARSTLLDAQANLERLVEQEQLAVMAAPLPRRPRPWRPISLG
jgi:hypothetical protein